MKNAKKITALVLAFIIAFSCFLTAFADATNKSEVESNNTMATANSFAVNSDKITGKLSTEDDVDYYTFSIAEFSFVNVSIEHTKVASTSAYFDVEVLDKDGKVVNKFSSIGSEAITVSPDFQAVKGTYYVKVTASTVKDVTLSYTISAASVAEALSEKENNNVVTDANSIKLSSRTDPKNQFLYTGIIENEADVDYYSFSVSKNSIVNVFLYSDDSSTGAFKATLVDVLSIDEGDVIHAEEKSFGSISVLQGETRTVSDEIGIGARKYYVKIESINGGVGTYYFKVQSENKTGYECEYNDLKMFPNEIYMAVKTGINGSSFDKNDVDCYKFVVTNSYKTAGVKFEITNKADTNASATWTISLETSDNENLDTINVTKKDAAEFKLADYKINPADVLYVIVKVKDGDPGDAEYQITFTTIEEEKQEEESKQNPFERFIQILKDTMFNGDSNLWSGVWEVIIAVPIEDWIKTGLNLLTNLPSVMNILIQIFKNFMG